VFDDRESSGRQDQAIAIHGAREHNLKNVSLTVPRGRFVVVTGVSGSGKSTLAFDLLFAHGKTFHDGGWFDATAGKPRVQVKRAKDGAWETVAELKDYPATTAKDSAEMDGGECFNCILAEPLKGWAIRVAGKRACGDNPQQAFSSCAELQAFSE
jgi:ATPase subunit of ABC transporter with duplicated ATPase domains